MDFIFCIQINTKVSKNWHYHFWWKQQIGRLVIFLQYIKKKAFCFLITAFVFYCDVNHLDILWGSSHVCCYFVFGLLKYGSSLLHHESKIWYIYIYIYIYKISIYIYILYIYIYNKCLINCGKIIPCLV